jgi:hypothetical protein
MGTRLQPEGLGEEFVPVVDSRVDLWWMSHCHDIDHTHTVSVPSHSHTVNTPAHTHDVSVPAHTHDVTIPDHSHDVNIPEHTHEIQYGIFEDTDPADVHIKINGTLIEGITLSGSLDTDISQYVGTPGETYNLEVTSSQNGRVNVWVSVQAFIQVR